MGVKAYYDSEKSFLVGAGCVDPVGRERISGKSEFIERANEPFFSQAVHLSKNHKFKFAPIIRKLLTF